MNTEVATLPPSQQLAKSMESHFAEFRKQSAEWMVKAKEIKVTDASQKELMEEAKKARLALRAIRIGIADKHQELKAEALLTGQTLDKIKRELTGMIEPIEAVLKEQEEFAETQEKKRLAGIRSDRLKALDGLIPDADAQRLPLAEMSEESFSNLLSGYQLAKEDRIKKENEAQSEQKRIHEENERLRLANEKAAKELEASQAKAKKLTDSINEQKAKEEQKKADELASKRKAQRAPDKVKLLAYSAALQLVKPGNMTTEEGEYVLKNVKTLMGKLVDYIEKQTAKL